MNNENYRITAVNRFKNPDIAVTNDLNEIVKLTAQLCGAPVALITLVDENTQWFKASVGVDIDCTNRELSFCNYTIKQNGLVIAHDTRTDERFKDNGLVTGEPFVRFYAGATLTTQDGYAIGSLCVIDFKPRDLNEHQQNLLKVLGKQAMNLMELNWSLSNIQQQQEHAKKQENHINIQNAALTRIAIMQSHDIRRPVASLIGIMALIKLEQGNTANYVDMLEQTINDLDKRIREIVTDSENTLNNNLTIVA